MVYSIHTLLAWHSTKMSPSVWRGIIAKFKNIINITTMTNMNQVYSTINVCRCGNIYYIFGQVHHVNVCRCQLFGHVHQFRSYSFGHLNSVKWITLFESTTIFKHNFQFLLACWMHKKKRKNLTVVGIKF